MRLQAEGGEMMDTKSKKNIALRSGPTKLKKRKQDKVYRKQNEKKYLYRHKKDLYRAGALVLIALVVVSTAFLYQSRQNAASTAALGDEVKFNFISYFDDGSVIQHTISAQSSQVTVDTPLDDGRLKVPQRLTLGGYKDVQGILIPLYWNDALFVSMKKGNTYTISIPAEEALGQEFSLLAPGEERVFSVPRDTEFDKGGAMERSAFEQEYGEVEIGMSFEIDAFKAVVTDVGETAVSYAYDYEEGDEVNLEYGAATVTRIGETAISARYIDRDDGTFYVSMEKALLPAHIKEITEDEVVIEIDHYNYKIRIEDITKHKIDTDDWTLSAGDYALVRYIGYYEDGEVFDASIIDDVELTPDLPLDNTYQHSELQVTVTPGTTLSGTSTLIKGFNEALKGMVAGDEKVITIPPEDGYGLYDEEKVKEVSFVVGTYPLMETWEKTVTLSVEEFTEQYAQQPLVNNSVQLDYGIGLISSVEDGVVVLDIVSLEEEPFYMDYFTTEIIAEDDETFTFQRNVEDGQSVPIPTIGGIAVASVADGMVTVAYDPDDITVGKTLGSGTVTNIDETGFTVDYNHAMAGKTLSFKIRVVAFKKV